MSIVDEIWEAHLRTIGQPSHSNEPTISLAQEIASKYPISTKDAYELVHMTLAVIEMAIETAGARGANPRASVEIMLAQMVGWLDRSA